MAYYGYGRRKTRYGRAKSARKKKKSKFTQVEKIAFKWVKLNVDLPTQIVEFMQVIKMVLKVNLQVIKNHYFNI